MYKRKRRQEEHIYVRNVTKRVITREGCREAGQTCNQGKEY